MVGLRTVLGCVNRLGGDARQETPQRQQQGTHKEVGSSVRIHGNYRGGRSKVCREDEELPFHSPLPFVFSNPKPPFVNASQSCC